MQLRAGFLWSWADTPFLTTEPTMRLHLLFLLLLVGLYSCKENTDQRQALQYHLKALKFELGRIGGRENLDSAIFYYRKALDVGREHGDSIDVMINLIKAYYRKSKETTDSAESKGYHEEACGLLSQLETMKVDKGQIAVLQRLVYHDETNWFYRREEKRACRIAK